jgi:GntR family transcriptional repressor for pyruvate dehydrogenase complex
MARSVSSAFTPESLNSASAAEQIADQLRAAMVDGSLNPGDRLPSEPDLAEGFGVSRPTVREAMRILRGQGVLVTSRGSKGGHFIRHPQAEDIAETLGETFSLWFDIGDISVAEVDEAREVVERACVRLAATRRTNEDLGEMGRILESASDQKLSLHDFLQLDVAFHRAVANAARNRLLNLPMQAIHIVRPRTNALLGSHDRQAVLSQHRALYDAIESGDPDGAEKCLALHVGYLAVERAKALRSEDKDVKDIPVSSLSEL